MKLEKKGGVGHQDDWSSHILPGDFSGLFLFIGMIGYPLTLPLTHTHTYHYVPLAGLMHTLVTVTKVTAHPAYALALAGFGLNPGAAGSCGDYLPSTYNCFVNTMQIRVSRIKVLESQDLMNQ